MPCYAPITYRYREFDALDKDLRDAYPDRKDALPRLPRKELFKLAADVVERRTKGLEMYMATIIRRFPDMLSCSHLDRFLTISERVSGMSGGAVDAHPDRRVSDHRLGRHGSSSNIFPRSSLHDGRQSALVGGGSSLVGTDYILNLMTSEKAYEASRRDRPHPIDVDVAEHVATALEEYVGGLQPSAHLFSDARLYDLVEQCQGCWPRIKTAVAAVLPNTSSKSDGGVEGGEGEELLTRLLQCDATMERAFLSLRRALASRGYIDPSSQS